MMGSPATPVRMGAYELLCFAVAGVINIQPELNVASGLVKLIHTIH